VPITGDGLPRDAIPFVHVTHGAAGVAGDQIVRFTTQLDTDVHVVTRLVIEMPRPAGQVMPTDLQQHAVQVATP
jgi:hypothetical protein